MLSPYFENLKIFGKSENFLKIWKFSENLKIWKLSENWKSENLLKIFRKSENFPKIQYDIVLMLSSLDVCNPTDRVDQPFKCSILEIAHRSVDNWWPFFRRHLCSDNRVIVEVPKPKDRLARWLAAITAAHEVVHLIGTTSHDGEKDHYGGGPGGEGCLGFNQHIMAPERDMEALYRVCKDYEPWSKCTIKQVQFFTAHWTRSDKYFHSCSQTSPQKYIIDQALSGQLLHAPRKPPLLVLWTPGPPCPSCCSPCTLLLQEKITQIGKDCWGRNGKTEGRGFPWVRWSLPGSYWWQPQQQLVRILFFRDHKKQRSRRLFFKVSLKHKW